MLDVENTGTAFRNFVNGFNSRLALAEKEFKRICRVNYRSIERYRGINAEKKKHTHK